MSVSEAHNLRLAFGGAKLFVIFGIEKIKGRINTCKELGGMYCS